MELFDGQGRKVSLGNELGRGGEGTAFDVLLPGANLAAKLYHGPVSKEKQEKLRAMVARSDDRLKAIAAWPLETLHLTRQGPTIGFVMPKAVNAEPLHHLYGPGHRKQQFPDADWAFLVNAARNVAAAFAVLHASGCVVGDVNPNLVFVGRNTVTRLIDCDSFQFSSGNRVFGCEVGVPLFTPPELQGLSSMRDAMRTVNHDRFGLSLLIFHLLLMGRHPFFGVYSGREDMPPERAIKEFRYAFSSPAGSQGMRPPPNTVGPEILPPSMVAMFELAFSKAGVQSNARPTAMQWVTALDGLKNQLRTCSTDSVHKYYAGIGACPWCQLESRTGFVCFINMLAGSPGPGSSSFDLARAWSNILAIASPGTAAAPSFVRPKNLKAKALPAEMRRAQTWRQLRPWIAVAVSVAGIAAAQQYAVLFLVLSSLCFIWGNGAAPERIQRKAALDLANKVSAAAWSQWASAATDKSFQDNLEELKQTRREYEELGQRLAQDKQRLHSNAREIQLRNYLERFFISDHDIPGIGPTRKAMLESFGVESAADVSWNRVRSIKGFGERLTGELVAWRKSLEARFVFDPNKGIAPADLATLQQRYAQLRRQLEGALAAGPSQLTQSKNKLEQQRGYLREMVLNADLQVAQAEEDYRVVK
ncbi:Helix-hairpin-helix domain-containing protein [Pararobbsia alpina]|uniref:hypothetical protein n=1 Tax=Pararobbsia alpina TaxID=621374 RepID=UPI0039A43DE1